MEDSISETTIKQSTIIYSTAILTLWKALGKNMSFIRKIHEKNKKIKESKTLNEIKKDDTSVSNMDSDDITEKIDQIINNEKHEGNNKKIYDSIQDNKKKIDETVKELEIKNKNLLNELNKLLENIKKEKNDIAFNPDDIIESITTYLNKKTEQEKNKLNEKIKIENDIKNITDDKLINDKKKNIAEIKTEITDKQKQIIEKKNEQTTQQKRDKDKEEARMSNIQSDINFLKSQIDEQKAELKNAEADLSNIIDNKKQELEEKLVKIDKEIEKITEKKSQNINNVSKLFTKIKKPDETFDSTDNYTLEILANSGKIYIKIKELNDNKIKNNFYKKLIDEIKTFIEKKVKIIDTNITNKSLNEYKNEKRYYTLTGGPDNYYESDAHIQKYSELLNKIDSPNELAKVTCSEYKLFDELKQDKESFETYYENRNSNKNIYHFYDFGIDSLLKYYNENIDITQIIKNIIETSQDITIEKDLSNIYDNLTSKEIIKEKFLKNDNSIDNLIKKINLYRFIVQSKSLELFENFLYKKCEENSDVLTLEKIRKVNSDFKKYEDNMKDIIRIIMNINFKIIRSLEEQPKYAVNFIQIQIQYLQKYINTFIFNDDKNVIKNIRSQTGTVDSEKAMGELNNSINVTGTNFTKYLYNLQNQLGEMLNKLKRGTGADLFNFMYGLMNTLPSSTISIELAKKDVEKYLREYEIYKKKIIVHILENFVNENYKNKLEIYLTNEDNDFFNNLNTKLHDNDAIIRHIVESINKVKTSTGGATNKKQKVALRTLKKNMNKKKGTRKKKEEGGNYLIVAGATGAEAEGGAEEGETAARTVAAGAGATVKAEAEEGAGDAGARGAKEGAGARGAKEGEEAQGNILAEAQKEKNDESEEQIEKKIKNDSRFTNLLKTYKKFHELLNESQMVLLQSELSSPKEQQEYKKMLRILQIIGDPTEQISQLLSTKKSFYIPLSVSVLHSLKSYFKNNHFDLLVTYKEKIEDIIRQIEEDGEDALSYVDLYTYRFMIFYILNRNTNKINKYDDAILIYENQNYSEKDIKGLVNNIKDDYEIELIKKLKEFNREGLKFIESKNKLMNSTREIKNAKEQEQKLKSDKEELDTEQIKLKKEISDKKSQIMQKKEAKKDKEEKNETLTLEENQLTKKIVTLTPLLEQHNTEKDRLTSEVNQTEKNIIDITRQIEEITQSIQDVSRAQNNLGSEQSEDKKKLDAQKKELDAQKKELDAQKKKLDAQKKKLDAQKKELENKLAPKQTEKQTIESQKALVNQNIGNNNDDIANLTKAIEQLEGEVEQEERKLEIVKNKIPDAIRVYKEAFSTKEETKGPFFRDIDKTDELKQNIDTLKKELEGLKNLNKNNTGIREDLKKALTNTKEKTDSKEYDRNNIELEQIEAEIKAEIEEQQPQEGDSKSAGDKKKNFQELVDKMFETFTEDADELPTYFSNRPIDTNRFDIQQRILLVRNMSEQVKQFRARVKSVTRIQALIKGKETRSPGEIKKINEILEELKKYIKRIEDPGLFKGGSNSLVTKMLIKENNFMNILYIYYKIRYSIFYKIKDIIGGQNSQLDEKGKGSDYLNKIIDFKKELQKSYATGFIHKMEDFLINKLSENKYDSIKALYNGRQDEDVHIVLDFMVDLFGTDDKRQQFKKLLESFIDVFENSISLNKFSNDQNDEYKRNLFNHDETIKLHTIIRYNERYGKEITGGNNKYKGGKIRSDYTISFAKGSHIDNSIFKYGVFKHNRNNLLLNSTHLYDINSEGEKTSLLPDVIKQNINNVKPDTIIVYGGSGSGKTHLVEEYIGGTDEKKDIHFYDDKKKTWEKLDDERNIIRSTPENINSSRVHTYFTNNEKTIYDLCGAEKEITEEVYLEKLNEHQTELTELTDNATKTPGDNKYKKELKKKTGNLINNSENGFGKYYILAQLYDDMINSKEKFSIETEYTQFFDIADLKKTHESICIKSELTQTVKDDFETLKKLLSKPYNELKTLTKDNERERDIVDEMKTFIDDTQNGELFTPEAKDYINNNNIEELLKALDESNLFIEMVNTSRGVNNNSSKYNAFLNFKKFMENNAKLTIQNATVGPRGEKFDSVKKEIKTRLEAAKAARVNETTNNNKKKIARMLLHSAELRVKESKQINETLKETIMPQIMDLKMRNNEDRPMLPLQECKNLEYQYGFVKFLTKTEEKEENEKKELSFFKKIKYTDRTLLLCVVDIKTERIHQDIVSGNDYNEYYKKIYGRKIKELLTETSGKSLILKDYIYFLKTYLGEENETFIESPELQPLKLTSSVETTLYIGSPFQIIHFPEDVTKKMLEFTQLNNEDDDTQKAFRGGKKNYKINKELKRLKNIYNKL